MVAPFTIGIIFTLPWAHAKVNSRHPPKCVFPGLSAQSFFGYLEVAPVLVCATSLVHVHPSHTSLSNLLCSLACFLYFTVCSVNVCGSRCCRCHVALQSVRFFGISHILVKFVAIFARPSEFGDVPVATVSCNPCPLCQSCLPMFAVSLFRELTLPYENSTTMPPVTNSQHPVLLYLWSLATFLEHSRFNLFSTGLHARAS